jgi:catechol 2,3-dioxygenase-like lactoylglutathione lyase family enzyme
MVMKTQRSWISWLVLAGSMGMPLLGLPMVRAAELLPIKRLAQVAFRGSDLEQTRRFYTGVMGFAEVQPREISVGAPGRAYFKVNDDQFLLFSAAAPGSGSGVFRLDEITFQTGDIAQAHAWLREHRLDPGPIGTNGDGNPQFSLTDPDGLKVSILEYRAGSWQAALRGKELGAERVSDRLQHVGLVVADERAATRFYRDRLGFWEQNRGGPPANPGEIRWIIMMMPRSKADFRGDFIEFMVHAADPPERRQHLCFAVPDIVRAHQVLVQRPGLQQQFKPFTTPTGLKLMNVRDPNGLRVEFWEVKGDQNE